MNRSLAFIALLFVACTAGTADTSNTPSARWLADELRRAGLSLRDAGTVDQPFFAVPAHVYVVDEKDLQVYEFANDADAEQAASQVAPSGTSIGTSKMMWLDAPHFFRKGRLVVNYIGTSEKVLAELQRLLGPQFAGR